MRAEDTLKEWGCSLQLDTHVHMWTIQGSQPLPVPAPMCNHSVEQRSSSGLPEQVGGPVTSQVLFRGVFLPQHGFQWFPETRRDLGDTMGYSCWTHPCSLCSQLGQRCKVQDALCHHFSAPTPTFEILWDALEGGRVDKPSEFPVLRLLSPPGSTVLPQWTLRQGCRGWRWERKSPV